MQTVFVFFFVVLAALSTMTVDAHPTLGNDYDKLSAWGNVEETGVRIKRVTCDLFSFESTLITPNHSLCAAHCLALMKGFKGGRCIDGVCVCRR